MCKIIINLLFFCITSQFCWAQIENIYDLKIDSIGGRSRIDFSKFKGKKILIVSIATKDPNFSQIDELKALAVHYRNRMAIILCPTSDFNSEKGTDDQISSFIKDPSHLFFVSSLLSVRGNNANSLFKFINKVSPGSRASQEIFQKIYFNEKGNLVKLFNKDDRPLNTKFINILEQ